MTCVYGTFCMPCLYGENVNREEGSNCILNCVVRVTPFCQQPCPSTQRLAADARACR